MDLERLRNVAARECALDPRRLVIVGVSGGADSIALLHALHQLELPVVAAYFDHHLRVDSAEDGRAVEQLARRLAVGFVTGEGNVRKHAGTQKISVEAAARFLRYRFLFTQARQLNAQAVAVAHHADDQVETMLLHLLRGTGLRGLVGMRWRAVLPQWDADLPLVRPLLGFPRAEILAYCQENGLVPRIDSTNEDTSYLRNRIRLELLPVLEGYNPRFRDGLRRLSAAAADELEIVDTVVQAAWRMCFATTTSGQINLRRDDLVALPAPLRRGVLRRAAVELLPAGEMVDSVAIRRADAFLETAEAGQVDLTGGLTLFLVGSLVSLTAAQRPPALDLPQLLATGQQQLPIPGRCALQSGWQIEAVPADPAQRPPNALVDRWEAWLDADRLSEFLTIRAPLPGDRLQPLGMDGHSMKLSDLLTNQKIPRQARAAWPLVTDGSTVVWVPGVRLSDAYRITEATTRAIVVRVVIA